MQHVSHMAANTPLVAGAEIVYRSVLRVSHYRLYPFVRVGFMLIDQLHQQSVLFHVPRRGLRGRNDTALVVDYAMGLVAGSVVLIIPLFRGS